MIIDIKKLFIRIDEYLKIIMNPARAKEKLELVLKIIICAWESAYFKRYADHLIGKIHT